MTERESDLRRARALGDRTRQAIYLALRDAEFALDVKTLTGIAGTHHTAVRQHLAKLLAAGLVVQEPLPSSGRGRPPIGYRAVPDPFLALPYRVLASLLASALRTGASVRDAGRAAGRSEALRAPEPAGAGGRSGLERLAEHTRSLGFDSEIRPGRGKSSTIVLRSCPFADVAADAPEVVCDLHLGIAEGLAEALGGVVVEGLRARDPWDAGCCLDVRETSP